MKRIILLVTGFLITCFLYAAPQDSLWQQANDYYANGQYSDAVRVYTEIEKTNFVSSDLYFNKGNAYFKQNDLANAILYFERAYRLAPNDAAIAHNLHIAQQRTQDKVEAVPEFILTTWLRDMRHWASSDTWAVLSLILVLVAFVFLGIFFFARSVRFRKISFFVTLGATVLVIGSFSFAFVQTTEMLDNSKSIIFPAVVTVKSAPDNTGKDLFILHEGTKVEVIDELAGWQNIRLADGKEGWIEASSTEKI